MKILSRILLIVLILGIFLFTVYQIILPRYDEGRTPTLDLSKFDNMPECIYYLDDQGEFLYNIPYNDYIQEITYYGLVFDIRDYGASTSKSSRENQVLIQNAINAAAELASAEMRATVLVTNGEYYSGTISLKSHITLYIAEGSALISADYENNERDNLLHKGFILAENAIDIEITGGGRISGQGKTYTNAAKDDSLFTSMEVFSLKKRVLEARNRIRFAKDNRVNLVQINDCSDVRVHNIELHESACWTLVLLNSFDINIENLIINNNIYVANTDGIDIVSSSNVNIKNCFIVTGDDGIVIKSNGAYDMSDIYIENCEVLSLANCFKIGTETIKDISNVNVNNCFFFNANIMGGYAGIAIESADGAVISDITIKDIDMVGITSPLLIWLGNRLNNRGEKSIGGIYDVSIENIRADNIDLPIAIVGCKVKGKIYAPQNIEINNLMARYRDSKERLSILYPIPSWSMSGYPEITRVSHLYLISHELSGYWDLPYYGIYSAHTDNVTLNNINIMPRSVNKRPYSNITNE